MSKDTTGEFARGYVLGFKHGKEYKAESNHHETIPNNDNVPTKDNTIYNYCGNFPPSTKKEDVWKREVRKDVFNDLLWDGTKIRLLSRLTCHISDVPLNPLQKKFAKYYFTRTEAGELFIPVVKMRQAGMTDILSEILFREYLAGKRVVYCAPNPNFAKEVKKTFERKLTHSNFVAIDGGSFDVFGIDDWNQFDNKISRNKYDVVAVDEIGLDGNFNYYTEVLNNYIENNNATVIFAFTPSRKMKYYQDAQKFVNDMECLGKVVYRYSTVALHILQPLKYTVKLEDSDEQLISTLIEMLGII